MSSPVRWLVAFSSSALAAAMSLSAQSSPSPEGRAVAFLVQAIKDVEKPGTCRSCHHHGEAVRALLLAGDRGHNVGTALDQTMAFLNDPAAWRGNPGHRDADKPVGRLLFASAQAAAGARDTNPSRALTDAAQVIEADQQADGSWTVEGSGVTTFGPALATWLARTTLISAGREPDTFAIAQADRWMRTVEAATVADAAGVVLGLGSELDVMATKARTASLDMLRAAQASSGGWSYQAGGAPQAFETSVAMLALREMQRDPRVMRSAFGEENLTRALAGGRQFLIGAQTADGGWPAGPGPGKPNIARRVSATAWALMALIESGPAGPP